MINENFVQFSEDDRKIQIMLAIKLDLVDKNQYENQTATEL